MNRYYSLYTEESGSELHIYGDIRSDDGWFGSESDVSSYRIEQELSGLDTSKPLTVYINSRGGMVGEGWAIYNQLKRFEKCKTVADGFVASIASVIFMAGKEREMSPASMLYIHNAWTKTAGNAEQLRKDADDLDKMTELSAAIYLEHVNIGEEKLHELMDAETWIDPDEAVEMGFATSKGKESESTQPMQKLMFKLKKPQTQTPPEPEETPMQKFFKSMAKRKDN